MLDPTQLDLAGIARQAVKEARPRAERKGLDLSCFDDARCPCGATGPDLPAARRPRLERDQVHARGRRRLVRTSAESGPRLLEVSDNGIGLAPGEAERVLERFFRSSREVDGQIPGTGLGLFIARPIERRTAGASPCRAATRAHDVPGRAAGADRG